MDKYEYKYQLNDEELLEYFRYAVRYVPTVKKQFLWIDLSVPVLIVIALFIFSIYQYLWVDIVAIALIFLWYSIGRSFVKLQFLHLRVDKEFLNKMNIKNKNDIHVIFDNEISINDNKIKYDELGQIIPLKKSVLFFFQMKELLILPIRVIGSNEQVGELYRFILLKEKEHDESKENN